MADDEFLLPSGLEMAIKNLNSDPELVSIMGRCIGFAWENNTIYTNPFYTNQKDRKLEQETPKERCLFHFSNYTPSHFYSVVRTPVWNMAWKSSSFKEFEVCGQTELQFELSVAYLGKSKVIPNLTWLRSTETNRVDTSSDNSMNYNLPHLVVWWLDPSKQDEHDEMIEIMAKSLKGDEETKNILREAFNKMAKKVDKSGKFKFYNRTKSRLKKLMIRLTPIKIRKLIKKNIYLELNIQN